MTDTDDTKLEETDAPEAEEPPEEANGDPFEGWPAADSAAVIEDIPADVSVEHVRGETPHFDYVAAECASGLQLAGIETGVPVAFGVLTVDNVAQAEARIERAADAVRSALEMADLFARLRASARA